jgi:hypothetical protein
MFESIVSTITSVVRSTVSVIRERPWLVPLAVALWFAFHPAVS